MKAVIAGATGLTGSTLSLELLARDEFSEITCLVRNFPDEIQIGLTYVPIDFDMIHYKKFNADTAFTCLGTTIKNAGSRENFYRVDYHYNLMFAEACKEQGIERFILLSALGANSRSSVFYNRVKGELEEAVINLNFKSLTIVRPSLLEGPRIESRPGELLARRTMKILNPLLISRFKKYRSVDVDKIASAMAEAAILNHPGVRYIENEEILSYS
jgi:uncharacterized protein YbjT (DUF2867 family)